VTRDAARGGAPYAVPGIAARVARFLVVGGLNTAFCYALFRVFLRALGGRPEAAGLAQGVAYGVGVAVSYAVNRRWTFQSGGAHGRALPRFVAAQLSTLALSTVVIQLAVTAGGLAPTPAWVLATAFTTAANFVTQQYWVFRDA
jgi:putative flippase GtrA